MGMNKKQEVREFLMTRRARVTPEQAGLRFSGEDRRVPGLRREEVAVLADVSIDYYTRLERGHIGGASESVLIAIAAALQLDDAERDYLFELARMVHHGRRSGAPTRSVPAVRPSVQRVLDAMDTPAVVHNTRQDLVAANELGRALYAPHFDTEHQPNVARFVFLDPRARDYYVDWAMARRTVAAMMRLEAGRNPLDADLTALIGELSSLSAAFREDWARHDVHEHRTGVKSFRHPDVGLVEVSFDVFETPGESGLTIVTYSTEPGTPSADAFALLATLSATRADSEVPASDGGDTRDPGIDARKDG